MAQIKYNLGDLGTEVYSTNETVIGTWINGKPIYRKVIDFGALPNKTIKSVAHNITNLDTITKLYGVANRDSDKTYLPLPSANSSSIANNLYLYIFGNNVNVDTGSNATSLNRAYIIIEYTKTTD